MGIFRNSKCIIVCVIFYLHLVNSSTNENSQTNVNKPTEDHKSTEEIKITNEKPKLKIEILKGPMGECGRKSKQSDLIFMHFTGFFENGTKFDSTMDKPGKQPINFQLGFGQVIQGWEEGLLDMCVGEKRKLFVPSHLAYDKLGAGVIPPDTNLIFEAEIVQIMDGPPPMNVFKMTDIDGDMHITMEEAALYLARQAIAQRVPDNIAIQHNKQTLEQLFMKDDKNKDGRVSFEEFSGPKQDAPVHDEL